MRRVGRLWGVRACVAHRDDAALAAERDDGVVGGGPAGRGVDDDEDLLVLFEGEGLRAEHGVDVDLAEDLLERVEGQARELGLDEVRAVLHHDLELAVALGALPLRDEVEYVHLREKTERKSAVVELRCSINVLYMASLSDDEAFAAICSVLDVGHIREFVLVSDDRIRSACPAELAPLLIKLKEDTRKEMAQRLALAKKTEAD